MRNTCFVKATAAVLMCLMNNLPCSQAAPQAARSRTVLTSTPVAVPRPVNEGAETGRKAALVTREALQSIYNEQNTLLAKKDSGGIWKRHAVDYKSVLPNGKTKTLAELRPGVNHILKRAKLIRANTTLQDIALEGNTVRVMVREAGTIVL